MFAPKTALTTALIVVVVALPVLATELRDTSSGEAETTNESLASIPFSQTIPALEVSPAARLQARTAHDRAVGCGGTDSGEICAMAMENLRLRSTRSVDGGATFSTEASVAGGTRGPDVFHYEVVGTDVGILVAMVTADPAGGRALQITRSLDVCSSWETPSYVVASGAPAAGVTFLHTDANESGRWVIYFHGADGRLPYVVTSDDSGVTWGSPVLLSPAWNEPVVDGDVIVDSSGVIYAVFVQDRGFGPHVFYTRSTDGGLSFEAERDMADLPLPGSGGQHAHPDLFVPDTDEVLLAFWDSAPRVYVLGTADRGQNYGILHQNDLTATSGAGWPRFFPWRGQQVVFLLTLEDDGRLLLERSEDSGQSWDPETVLTTTAAGPDSAVVSRTAAGKMLAVWTDNRADPYAGMLNDLYLRVSSDAGATWAPEQRVNSGAPGATVRQIGPLGVTGVGTGDEFIVCYRDARDQDAHSSNVYVTRGTALATSATLQPDARIDTDVNEPLTVPLGNIPAVATDGVDRAYVAFPGIETSPYLNVYVAASIDGGYTFTTPVRVGSASSGTSIEWFPAVTALPGDHVYVSYVREEPGGGGRELRFTRSTNHGLTWSGDTILHTYPWPSDHQWEVTHPAMQIAAEADGTVRVVYSDGSDVFLSTSTDFGQSFTQEELDAGLAGPNRMPRMCADGDQVVVTFVGPGTATGLGDALLAVVSEDGGVNWADAIEMRPGGAGPVQLETALACGPGGQAVAVWSQPLLAGERDVRSIRYDGSEWGASQSVPLPFVSLPQAGLWPSAAFSGPDNVVLAHEIYGFGVYMARSIDGGASWLPSILELSAGGNGAAYFPYVVSDGTGRVWVSWLDERAGQPTVAMRYSPDHGASFFTTYRMERATPQGAHDSLHLPTFQAAATLPGVAFTTWGALRQTPDFAMPLLNAWDATDLDRDTEPDVSDCLFYDPTAFAVPNELQITQTQLDAYGDPVMFWVNQSRVAGSGTTYDIVTGRLSDLRAAGDYSASTCLVNSLTDSSYADRRSPPPAGDADWVLLRGQNNCGPGTFGDGSELPDPRDALEGFGTPCP